MVTNSTFTAYPVQPALSADGRVLYLMAPVEAIYAYDVTSSTSPYLLGAFQLINGFTFHFLAFQLMKAWRLFVWIRWTQRNCAQYLSSDQVISLGLSLFSHLFCSWFQVDLANNACIAAPGTTTSASATATSSGITSSTTLETSISSIATSSSTLVATSTSTVLLRPLQVLLRLTLHQRVPLVEHLLPRQHQVGAFNPDLLLIRKYR